MHPLGIHNRRWPGQGHTAQGAGRHTDKAPLTETPGLAPPQGQLSWRAADAETPGHSLVWPHLRPDTPNPGFFFLKSTTRAIYILRFRPPKARISPSSPPTRFPLPFSHSSRIPNPRALSQTRDKYRKASASRVSLPTLICSFFPVSDDLDTCHTNDIYRDPSQNC